MEQDPAAAAGSGTGESIRTGSGAAVMGGTGSDPGGVEMFEIEATVNVPFEFCQYCGLLDLSSETLYANGRPFMTVMRCENAGVCQNAVRLMEEVRKND